MTQILRAVARKRSATCRFGATPIVAALALLALSVMSVGCGTSHAEKSEIPAPQVEVATVLQQDVPVVGDWVATLDGYVNAQIQPQVSGYLIKQNYHEGEVVRKGQVLFEIDPRPFQAVLDQALGQLAQNRAQLELANINVKRDTPLAEGRALARSQLDNDLQQQAVAAATVKSSEASVEQAQLNLGFTKVLSLVDGIAGQAQTQVGNLVTQSTVLTAVSQVNPVKAYFAISEQEYLNLSKRVKSSARQTGLLNSGEAVPLQLTLGNGDIYPQRGRIIFVDRQVNTQTGTIRIAAAFANPQNLLRPGQFGRIQARTGLQRAALLVPQRAVGETQGNYHVVVVGSDNVAKVQNVKVGRQIGTLWIIEDGLKPGDRVVTEGLTMLRDGTPVAPVVGTQQSSEQTAGSPSGGK
jgi:RND family efflux transporter MFP subunit